MGNCIDFGGHSPYVMSHNLLGTLMMSEESSMLMKKDESRAVQMVRKVALSRSQVENRNDNEDLRGSVEMFEEQQNEEERRMLNGSYCQLPYDDADVPIISRGLSAMTRTKYCHVDDQLQSFLRYFRAYYLGPAVKTEANL